MGESSHPLEYTDNVACQQITVVRKAKRLKDFRTRQEDLRSPVSHSQIFRHLPSLKADCRHLLTTRNIASCTKIRQDPGFISAQELNNYVRRQNQQPPCAHYVRTPGNTEGNGASRVRLPAMKGFISTFEYDVAFAELLLNDIYRFQDPQMEQFRMAIGRVKFALLMMKDEWRRFLESDHVESESEPQSRLDAPFSRREAATNGGSSGHEGDVNTESRDSGAEPAGVVTGYPSENGTA
ncbi:uncharacterized protein B0T15DRAFT_510594 [Chaetomium strumarium]|uniref:Uncharacterized protein n=1 Tax=Chaetomium strumarium TaxID=1170767 RepID=A0AAJ0M382_9PEZI|nr:hypothetical protein B0T15DRAFT_510594 [Chaetomium strumarium]